MIGSCCPPITNIGYRGAIPKSWCDSGQKRGKWSLALLAISGTQRRCCQCPLRALRGIALGRKSWLFAGSDHGGERTAFIYTLIGTAKLNNIDPQAWLADTLARINDISQSRLHELLPWNWASSAEHSQIKLAA
jgi:IS66 C-terminal element